MKTITITTSNHNQQPLGDIGGLASTLTPASAITTIFISMENSNIRITFFQDTK